MRLFKDSDTEDGNIQTLLWLMRRPSAWDGGVDWKDWGFSFRYTWYDGPIWQLWVGPFWCAVGPWYD